MVTSMEGSDLADPASKATNCKSAPNLTAIQSESLLMTATMLRATHISTSFKKSRK